MCALRSHLAIRAGLARTFGSLAGFVVVTFLCWGFYILAALSIPQVIQARGMAGK